MIATIKSCTLIGIDAELVDVECTIYVQPVPLHVLRGIAPGESSAAIRARVVGARDRQLARRRPWSLPCNAEMASAVIPATCKLDGLGERTLVARTTADLLGHDDIDARCLLEAAAYRDVDPTADLVPQVA